MRLKSNPKRIISLALAGCMAVSMVPASAVTAFAEEAAGTGPSITVPATVKVEVTLDGTQTLEDAVKAENQDLASITELKVITNGSAALTKADFQFMSGVVVSETENGRFSSEYKPDDVTCLNGLQELDLSQATCENNAIPPRAFQRNTTITKVVLPNNLERTYIHAFSMMTNLAYLGTTAGNLHFPDSMKIMGEGMVYQDTNLMGTLTFPANLEAIGSACFYDSGISGKVVIPASVNITTNTDIKSGKYEPSDDIFRKSKITSLEFKNGVEEISVGFARECGELTSVILPSTVKKIDAHAFRETNLSSLPNLENVTEIGESAFRELKSEINGDLTLSNGVTYGDSAFRGLKLNGNLTIDTQNIGDYTFMESNIKGNVTLGCATVPAQILYRGGSTYNGESLIGGHLTLKPGVTTITNEAFNGAGLTGTLTIPEGVTTIGESAFRCNQFSGTIVIPESVESIGVAAFSYAGGGASTSSSTEVQNTERKIDSIIVENPSVTLGQYAFSNQKNGVKLYFTSDSAPENPNSMYWSSGTSIVLLTAGGKIDTNKDVDKTTGLYTPEKEGYTFAGWYDANGNELKTTAAKNNTYTAKWKCTVSFNTNGHGTKPDDVVVEKGATLSAEDLSEDGWVFEGWYLDSDFTTKLTKDTTINQNTTVYAKWHEFTNTTIEATASKDGEYLLSEPVEINFKVNIGDDISSINGLSLEYGDEVESVKLNGTKLEKDKKDYTKNDLLTILNQKPEGTLTVTYNKTGKHTFGVVLKDSAGKETSKTSVDVTVVEMMMDATVSENGESKESYKANEPVKVTLKVTPSDLDAFKEDVLHLTYGEEVEKVELNGHKLTEKQYKISDLLDMMNSAASQVATYALGAEEVNIPLDVTYKTAGTHAFKMEVKNTEGTLICQDSVNVTIAEEQKPDDGKKDDTKPENPVTTYALTVKDGTVKVNGKDATANESGAYAVEKDAKVEVTFDKTTLSDAQVFDQWTITPASVLNAVDPKSETISFTMPAEEVSIKAMTRDATIEDDGPGVLGTAAMIGVGVAGTAVLGYQGYMIGTELYLNNVLPAGAAIPQNYGELAKLVWTDAGQPTPAAVLAADATDEQKALTWAVENQLISADKAADASVTRWEAIQTWNQVQEMKKA